jgi:hypothetical protein
MLDISFDANYFVRAKRTRLTPLVKTKVAMACATWMVIQK